MSEKTYNELKQSTLNLYRSIGVIECPALGNEKIYFNSQGFRHFIYTKRGKRVIGDQIRRFELLPHAVLVLKNSKSIVEERRKSRSLTFLSVGSRLNFPELSVIIRRIGQGRYHFFSLIPKKRKDPKKGLS